MGIKQSGLYFSMLFLSVFHIFFDFGKQALADGRFLFCYWAYLYHSVQKAISNRGLFVKTYQRT
jgi:hypothetical protein